ncbi:hypothetical protein TH53_22430 [Pedobacter lusitanus]|uniref:Uncharacterized protein n=1 Tax=Pedobacter lusitanus TaxID=1503925 RepID=A0A0D0F0E0_9SPHI|nr:hypothetical protein [Pedobacter lusitanus]KIO75098.1 hypothetical protein TH53_22430 [Pedobacter lusitanus]
MKINEYIESGILEAYVLGSASEAETRELLYLKAKHPQIQDALLHLEIDMERIAEHMAITPPPDTWLKIEDRLNELAETPDYDAMPIRRSPNRKGGNHRKSGQFIEVDASSSHMRVHKIWRWLFIGVFILGKVFLGFAIYFYLENRQLKEEVSKLKTQLEKYEKQKELRN